MGVTIALRSGRDFCNAYNGLDCATTLRRPRWLLRIARSNQLGGIHRLFAIRFN